MLSRLTQRLRDLPLRTSIAVALVVGLTIPIGLSILADLAERQRGLRAQLVADHERVADVLALGLETPIWEIRPDAAWQLVEAVLLDERVTAIVVTTPVVPEFLRAEMPERRRGQLTTLEEPVMHAGQEIGRVRVEMDTGELEGLIHGQWARTIVTGLLQLAIGLAIMFALLRLKVLGPVTRLVRETESLAEGAHAAPLNWRQADEIGALGRSFESARQALQGLVANLEERNRELAQRESQLQRQTLMLRNTLDNMTDGLTVIDFRLRLLAWNDRFLEIMDLPEDLIREGVSVQDLVRFDLERSTLNPDDSEEIRAQIMGSYREGQPHTMRFHTPSGRWVFIRRKPRAGGGFVSTYTDITDQVEAQQEAEQSRQLLEAVMDSVPAMIHVKDRHLRYRMVNREFLRYLRRDREDVLHRTAEEIFPREVARLTLQRDRMVLASGEASPFAEVPFFGDRAPFTAWSTKVPLRNREGVVEHLVTVELDITELKQAQQERERWSRLLNDAVDSIPNGFGVYDTDKRLVLGNGAFASFYNQSIGDMIGQTATEILKPAAELTKSFDGRIPASVKEHIQRYWAGGDPIEVELKDGRWFLISTHPTSEGGLVFVRTDISHVKRMERDLRASEQRFRSIAQEHPVPVLIAGVGQREIVYANPSASRIMQLPVDAVVGNAPEQFFRDTEQRRQLSTKLTENEAFEGLELTLLLPGGGETPVEMTGRRISYEEQDATVLAMIDLSDRKRAEREIAQHREALHQSEKLSALGSLLAGVAHELNNPLSVVVGRAVMLEEKFEGTPEATSIKRIRDAAERCARIVRTFLAMAREQELSQVAVNLREVLDAAFDMVGYGLRTHGVQVHVEVPEDLPTLTADPDQLTQVFTNLFLNAQQAMEGALPPHELRISAEHDHDLDALRVRVSDTGPGIDPGLVSRVFEPFFTTKGIGQGTGVGLSVSTGIVQAHGGRIDVQLPPTGGTTFEVTLPLGKQPSAENMDEDAEPAPTRGHQVLIVDDEPDLAQMLAEILSRQGHRVSIAGNGREALETLAGAEFDLVLSDIRMPDMDGPELVGEIRSRYPALAGHVIFMTGDTLSQSASEFIAGGNHLVIEKPFSPSEVRRVVSERLGTP